VFVAFSAHRDSRRYYHAKSENAAALESGHDLGDDWIDFEEEDEDALAPANLWRSDAAVEGQPWRSADDEAEEAKLDSVLAKLHDSGFDALSMEDRQLLERASRRYRSRLQKGTAEDA
jgi:hypothetical protein